MVFSQAHAMATLMTQEPFNLLVIHVASIRPAKRRESLTEAGCWLLRHNVRNEPINAASRPGRGALLEWKKGRSNDLPALVS